MKRFIVRRAGEAEPLHEGDLLISFRGERHTFISCAHPRRVYVRDGHGRQCEYFPSVFNVTIDEE